ncbi:transcriptional regulator/sugar kinase [Longilinea arvoryzae]|uniref:Transcriptional regulator/sugar kinase n=1 Tax=Longilinea arvoryzae TaxID=360412 RepID=A0A0S7B6M1_9CHLR|nr:ROK family transcriptional regulator [Longilinea arvoryzae]GAP12860.1 transcriptional regulator/sugar kinase [Longilinea arvoryzae]
MSALPRANRNLIRSINRSIILNVVKTQGEVSRAAIAHLTGLSPATVTAITGQLIKEGLVFEKTTGDSTGGRPPIMLALNPRGGFVIGIKLMEDQAVGALTDLNATILAKDSIGLSGVDVDTAVDTLVALVARLTHGSGVRKKQLMGVGIGLAGVVDYANGIVRQNPFFGWQNIPLRNLLQNRLKVPVYIDNDVNTLTLSEKWLSVGKPVDNFVVITIGRGVGMGIVLDGRIYRGKGGGAGEFGHVVVDPDGPLCDCGKHGCLESLVSDHALVAIARREVDPGITNLDGLLELAQAGRPEALAVLKRAGGLLGLEIANLVNVLDPNLIVISGEGIRMGETFFTAVRSAFHENVMPGLAEDTEIRVDSWGDDIWALGAASLVIAGTFNSPI